MTPCSYQHRPRIIASIKTRADRTYIRSIVNTQSGPLSREDIRSVGNRIRRNQIDPHLNVKVGLGRCCPINSRPSTGPSAMPAHAPKMLLTLIAQDKPGLSRTDLIQQRASPQVPRIEWATHINLGRR
jgi:hypothetical protein